MEKVIAERELFYVSKGEQERKKVVVKIFAPHLIAPESAAFLCDPGTAGCVIEFDGLGERFEVFGMDTLQALEMATQVDRYLKGLSKKKYDFFWTTGEPYFEDEA